MAFETSSYQNGQWTTRTLDVNAVLRHYDQEDREARMLHVDVEKAPVVGILTQTVIRSPLVHWILPVRLRVGEENDVAFIGDDFVQIKELRPDKLLWDVIRKENFGARIRNAQVIGSMNSWAKDKSRNFGQIKDEDDDVTFVSDVNHVRPPKPKFSPLPPQMILLQLETGDSVFLLLTETEDGSVKFISSYKRVARSMLKLQPGMHLTVDPSSRYMAVGCSEALFGIYALHSRKELSEQYIQKQPVTPIDCDAYITVRGIILKMEFLHPSPDDPEHIILLILVVVKGKTRMLTYEWETGSDLQRIKPHSSKGHLLNDALQMPLLLIPLKARSAFALIYEQSVTVCRGLLEGSPLFLDFPHRVDAPTELHHGKGIPLWTSWARAPRTSDERNAKNDDIYVVREDGVLKFLDFSIEDVSTNNRTAVGHLRSNCGTALACLDYSVHHTYQRANEGGDFIVTGGDSSAGGTYLVQARKLPEFIEPIRNWSPAVDLVTTYNGPRSELEKAASRGRGYPIATQPDHVFACVGKGINGAIVELRHGLEAKLGLSVDYPTYILEAWALSPSFGTVEEKQASLFLLSLGECSAVLKLSADAKEIMDDEENTMFDLSHRTITAQMGKASTIQVTEQSIVTIDESFRHAYENDEILRISQGTELLGFGAYIDKAIISEGSVFYTTNFDHSTYLQVLEPSDLDPMDINGHSGIEPAATVRTISKHSLGISAIGTCLIQNRLHVVTAEHIDDSAQLVFTHVDTAEKHVLATPSSYDVSGLDVEPIVSIVTAFSAGGRLTLLCGTFNGLVLTLVIDETTFEAVKFGIDRLGMNQVIVKRDENSRLQDHFFAACDSKIYGISPSPWSKSRLESRLLCPKWKIRQIWLTDASTQELKLPEINSIVRLKPSVYGGKDGNVLMVAGSQILIAAFSAQEKTVPRRLNIKGTPTRLLYSRSLDLLVVAAIVQGRTTLLFIDPNTGEDLSLPINPSNSEPVDFISGLGNINEKIFHLIEWSYTKDNKTWYFVIVATSTGRLLIVSAKVSHKTDEIGQRSGRPKIRFYTRHKFKCPNAVYSVTSFEGGLIWCSGDKLFCDILDIEEKKFKRLAECELLSPALSLSEDNGTIFALTSSHSLEILKLVEDEEGAARIVHTHVDQVARNSLFHTLANRGSERPIHFVSDMECSMVGLWATQDTKADTLETIFEAELPHSILRFRQGRVRPAWDTASNPLNADLTGILTKGSNLGSLDPPEIVGLAIDGSLSHYSMLSAPAWKFLRFIINLSLHSREMCEFDYKDKNNPGSVSLEPLTTPKIMMHIDGDILKRCLDEQHLEHLLETGEDDYGLGRIWDIFYELLQELHMGTLEEGKEAAVYVEQAYEDLGFFLRPVL